MNKILTKLGIYRKSQVISAFEFGMQLTDIAQQQKIELTLPMVQKVEDMIINEMKQMSPVEFVHNTLPLMLAIIQEIVPPVEEE